MTGAARAEVKKEINPWTGKMRHRCQGCGKVAFPTEAIAQEAVDKILAGRGTSMYVYLGPRCGWYHLSRADR